MKTLLDEVRAKVKYITTKWFIGDVSMLNSMSGCERQFPHADVTYWDGDYETEIFSVGGIIAIEKNTTITKSNEVVSIPCGYMIVFRGDFRYAGS